MTALKQQTKSLSCPQGRLGRPKAAGALSAFLVELGFRRGDYFCGLPFALTVERAMVSARS
jgi:hypothetical protein